MDSVKGGRAYHYSMWCINKADSLVNRYVKAQCRDWLDIVNGKNPDAYVDEDEYRKICKVLRLVIHPDLRCSLYDGMEDYAWLFVTAVMCTMCRPGTEFYTDAGVDPNDEKIRYYQTALLEICRKNFKTFNSGIIFVLEMITSPEFSRFFSVAPDLKLSQELQIAIKKLIKSSPLLCDELDPAFKVMRSEIRCNFNDSTYIPLAYSQDKMDGKLPTAVLADEAGCMDDYPLEAMRSGQITLYNKLGIIISTQYPNDHNGFDTEVDISKKILDGIDAIEDKRRFSLLYEPDQELQYGDRWKTDDNVIFQSNPVAVNNKMIFKDLIKKRSMAILYESKRENFLCKHCNIKYSGLGVEGFVDIQKVRLCRVEDDPEFWRGRRVFIGLDLSISNDNTSVAMLTEEDGYVYSKTWGFIPADRIEEKTKKEGVDYKKLISSGECIACGSEVIDYSVVENHIMNLPDTYGVEIVQVGYDRYNAISSVQKLEAAGIECVEIKQHSSVLHMPTKWLLELILNKQYRYMSNRMLEINFQNARCTEDTNRNKYVNKKRSAGKVDMVVSNINGLYLLQQDILYGSGGFVCQTI